MESAIMASAIIDTKEHRDIHFEVKWKGNPVTITAYSMSEALAYMDGKPGSIDVCVGSDVGAYWYGGQDAVDAWDTMKDSDVLERWIKPSAHSKFYCIDLPSE